MKERDGQGTYYVNGDLMILKKKQPTEWEELRMIAALLIYFLNARPLKNEKFGKIKHLL